MSNLLNRIEKLIKEISGLDAFELISETKHGWEFYFIKGKLDQNRVTDEETVTAKLYVKIKEADGKEFLGSASGKLYPTLSDEEIKNKLMDIRYRAGLVKNPYYTLTDVKPDVPAKLSPVDISKVSGDFIRTIKELPADALTDVNSFEVFVSSVTRKTINSNGVSYECAYPSSVLDLVVNAREKSVADGRGREIELYRILTSGTCDSDNLKETITELFNFGTDRLKAEPTPKTKIDTVILSTQDACELYNYFIMQMNASYKVRKISAYEKDVPIAEGRTGDKISIKALSSLKNSCADYPVDEEGAVIRERYLIENDVPLSFWGSRQFMSYLGEKESGIVRNVSVDGGISGKAELRTGDYIEVVEFSDFQVDPMSGDIVGEIRLGYLHEGDSVKIVTGGSISGSIVDVLPSLKFSSETKQYDTLVIPEVTRMEGMRITGVV